MVQKFSGNYLLGYEGLCSRCKQTEKAYYYFADSKHRKLMEDGVFMSINANCPPCVTSKIFSSPHTMVWQRQLPKQEVMNDLKILTSMNIDFDAAESSEKKERKMDAEIESYEKEVNEKLKWAKYKKGVDIHITSV